MKDLNDIDPVALLRANVARPFEQARAMPPEVYTSEAFLAAELEHVFAPGVALPRPRQRARRARRLRRLGDRRPAGRRRPRPRGHPARLLERLPAPHVDAAPRPRPDAGDRLPLPRLDLQPRRHPARRAGDVEERRLRPRGLLPAAAPLRGVAGLGLRHPQPRRRAGRRAARRGRGR